MDPTSQTGPKPAADRPKPLPMLVEAKELRNAFSRLKSEHVSEVETELDEGPYHQGHASTTRYIGVIV